MDQSDESVAAGAATEPRVSSADGWVDLSMAISEAMPRWQVAFASVYGGCAHMMTTVTLPVHAGTHLDAPLHYVPGGPSVDEFPLELALSEALVVDLTHVEKNQCIEPADLTSRLPADHPETVLLRTDWPRRALHTPRFWEDAPFVSEEAALWLADRPIKMIGFDFPQEEAIKRMLTREAELTDFTVHLAFLSRGIWQIEYLVNLHELPSERVSLLVMPLSLAGLDGSPVRVLARNL